MIKGVNRQVLEVTNTENPYFEKIIFFVKPEYAGEDRAKLKKEAESLSKVTQKPPKSRRTKKEIKYLVFQSFLCIAAGVAVTFLINYFI
ncbi:MAG: hypothetical protein LUH82_07590 [Clostridiales bacterium]|nr:hypothetical protein [Clostridiales bacterium]